MPTIAQQLTQLESDRQDLVDNLETKGITGLSGDETFTELVPEVLNISGGGGGGSNIFQNEIDYGLSKLYTYLNNNLLNKSAYSNQNETLYTPDSECKFYVIQKRSSGKYRACWLVPSILMITSSNISVSAFDTNSYYTYLSVIEVNDISSFNKKYYSEEYDTIEEVINRMKNNTLTYTMVRNYLAYVADNDYIIPYSNAVCYYQPSNSYLNTQIISHNENIITAD